MFYQVISPMFTQIEGNSLADAIKMFVKVNYANQIKNLIIADQTNKYNANINYYKKNNKNKIAITINKNPEYTVYPDNYVQPIYRDSENGLSPDVVGMGMPLDIPRIRIETPNALNITPVITGPGLISTTNTGIVSPINTMGLGLVAHTDLKTNETTISAPGLTGNTALVQGNGALVQGFNPGLRYLAGLI